MESVFLIWPLSNSAPRSYNNKEAAISEAKRLARLNPGETFYVLAAITKVTIATPLEIVDIDPTKE